jgi:hypothetical protein
MGTANLLQQSGADVSKCIVHAVHRRAGCAGAARTVLHTSSVDRRRHSCLCMVGAAVDLQAARVGQLQRAALRWSLAQGIRSFDSCCRHP